MSRGGARAGAGRPRKPLELHLLKGSYRRDRHGELPEHLRPGAGGQVLAMPAPAKPPAADWRPTRAERKALSPRARARLDATLAEFKLDALEGGRLLDALRSLSRLEQLETAYAGASVESDTGRRRLAAIARETKLFLSLWAAIGLPKE